MPVPRVHLRPFSRTGPECHSNDLNGENLNWLLEILSAPKLSWNGLAILPAELLGEAVKQGDVEVERMYRGGTKSSYPPERWSRS